MIIKRRDFIHYSGAMAAFTVMGCGTAEAATWSGDPSRLSVKAALLDGAKWDAYRDEDFQISGGYSGLPTGWHGV